VLYTWATGKGAPLLKRNVFWIGLALLLAWAGCSRDKPDEKPAKPQGPYASLAARLPAGSDLVLLADLHRMAQGISDLQQDLLGLPAVKNNPALQRQLEGQLSLVRVLTAGLGKELGLDPMRDLERAALGVTLPDGADPGLVLAVEGSFPDDLFGRLGGSPVEEKPAGHQVWRVGDGLQGVVLEKRTLLVADRAHLQPALDASANEAGKKLVAAHPRLFSADAPEFKLRVSLVVPGWLRKRLAGVRDFPLTSTLAGVDDVLVEVADGFALSAGCKDARVAENMRALLEAESRMMTGTQHLLRGAAWWLLVMDLDALPEIPGEAGELVASVLEDREALLATLEQVLPAPKAPPPVMMQGRRVTLKAGPEALQGNLLLVGMAAAVAVPAFIEYYRKADRARDEEQEP